MKKQVINSTEGGAHIRGTKRMSLKKAIQKYCKKTIDKSKITPLLSLADNRDELITKVIPLLEDDIKNLDEIITNSHKGLAINRGLRTLINRPQYKGILPKRTEKMFDKLLKESKQESQNNYMNTNHIFYDKLIKKLKKCKLKNIIILSEKNFKYSEAAHIAALKNPLINVAIYGASRAIQSRQLKVNETINHFLKNKKDALIRIDRNTLILTTARTAAKSLKKSYKETLKLLKKYDETKDNSLLVSDEIEPINLDDAEDYFKAGNWAHPLLDAEKIIDTYEQLDLCSKAEYIYNKAIKMRTKAIEKAKADETENADHESKLLKYNDLLKRSREIGGKDKNFDQALKLLKQAARLMPKELEAQWGVATALHHAGRIDESIKEYRKLIKDFPDNYTFQFEFGQVLLRNNQPQEGIKQIKQVMQKTEEFDNFFARLGEIYEKGNMFKDALIAYTSYLKKYPYDYKIWNKKGDCLSSLGRKTMAEKAYNTALKIKS